MEENENNKTIPKVDLVDKGNTPEVSTSIKMTRREFLKEGAFGMLALGIALTFGGCKPKNVLGTEPEKDNLGNGIGKSYRLITFAQRKYFGVSLRAHS